MRFYALFLARGGSSICFGIYIYITLEDAAKQLKISDKINLYS